MKKQFLLFLPVLLFIIACSPLRKYSETDSKKCDETDGVFWIAMYDEFQDKTGNPNPDLYADDNVHLNAKGYKIWTNLIKQALDEKL